MPTLQRALDFAIDITPSDIADLLAACHDDEQAEVFNKFAKIMDGWGNPKRSAQITWLVEHLDNDGARLISDLFAYMQYEIDQKQKKLING